MQVPPSLVIVDYGMGNIGSIGNLLERCRTQFLLSSDPEKILAASKLILPGVGNFQEGMKNLRQRNLVEVLSTAVLKKKTPILGICLGMQLMTRSSEEGGENGLGWIDAQAKKFAFGPESRYRVPHVGFNSVAAKRPTLFKYTGDEPYFYFTHSYFVECNDPTVVAGTTKLDREFHSAVEKENIFGVQFHPEKSHRSGLALIKAFLEA
jgi:imidazole glycerol-phosphate synthase subunit HisH